MPSGFDTYKNGLIFGALFGVLLLFAAINTTALSFLNSWMNSLTGWLTSKTWYPTSLNFTYLNYVLAGLIGAIIGIYIDKK